MRIKTVLAALCLTALPGLAMAQGCAWGHSNQEASMSCAQGTTFDAQTGTCVPTVSS